MHFIVLVAEEELDDFDHDLCFNSRIVCAIGLVDELRTELKEKGIKDVDSMTELHVLAKAMKLISSVPKSLLLLEHETYRSYLMIGDDFFDNVGDLHHPLNTFEEALTENVTIPVLVDEDLNVLGIRGVKYGKFDWWGEGGRFEHNFDSNRVNAVTTNFSLTEDDFWRDCYDYSRSEGLKELKNLKGDIITKKDDELHYRQYLVKLKSAIEIASERRTELLLSGIHKEATKAPWNITTPPDHWDSVELKVEASLKIEFPILRDLGWQPINVYLDPIMFHTFLKLYKYNTNVIYHNQQMVFEKDDRSWFDAEIYISELKRAKSVLDGIGGDVNFHIVDAHS